MAATTTNPIRRTLRNPIIFCGLDNLTERVASIVDRYLPPRDEKTEKEQQPLIAAKSA
jgi:hypothetical protein